MSIIYGCVWGDFPAFAVMFHDLLDTCIVS
jgi:hypothetical protein